MRRAAMSSTAGGRCGLGRGTCTVSTDTAIPPTYSTMFQNRTEIRAAYGFGWTRSSAFGRLGFGTVVVPCSRKEDDHGSAVGAPGGGRRVPAPAGPAGPLARVLLMVSQATSDRERSPRLTRAGPACQPVKIAGP